MVRCACSDKCRNRRRLGPGRGRHVAHRVPGQPAELGQAALAVAIAGQAMAPHRPPIAWAAGREIIINAVGTDPEIVVHIDHDRKAAGDSQGGRGQIPGPLVKHDQCGVGIKPRHFARQHCSGVRVVDGAQHGAGAPAAQVRAAQSSEPLGLDRGRLTEPCHDMDIRARGPERAVAVERGMAGPAATRPLATDIIGEQDDAPVTHGRPAAWPHALPARPATIRHRARRVRHSSAAR